MDVKSFLFHNLPPTTKICIVLLIVITLLVQIGGCDWLCLLAGYLMPPVNIFVFFCLIFKIEINNN